MQRPGDRLSVYASTPSAQRRLRQRGEWYKIGREQLVPHDGFYDVRITAELWEVYYYDYVALMAVDHPAGTEIFVDERFVVPPAKLGFTTVATPHKIARAIDDNGQDVTSFLGASWITER